MWMVRIYVGRDPETGKRKYIGKSIHGGLRGRTRLLRNSFESTEVRIYDEKPTAYH
jgi:hypothetical protein